MSLAWSGRQAALAALAALTIVRLAVAGTAPLSPDEAYYWVWSRALAPGYLDHPPMVALWIRLGTMLAGPGALGIRLLGPCSAALGTLLLWRAARDLGHQPAVATRACALLNATLLFGVGAATMTPDTPLMFFWAMALWAMARLIATGHGGWWLVVGAACGLACCSKYTAVLLPLGIVLWLAWARQWHWLARLAPWLGAALGGAIVAPVVWWNAAHGWASFAKQGGRGFVFHPARAVAYLAELAGGQIGLATPGIAIMCLAGVVVATRAALRTRDPGVVLLAAFTLPGAALFTEHALGDRVQANWPAVIYPAAAIAAAGASGVLPAWLYRPSVALGLVMTMLVYVQSTAAPLALRRGLDPTLRLSAGYTALAAAVQAEARVRHAAFIAADDYGAASLLAALSPSCLPVVGLEPRWRLFRLPDAAGIMNGRPGVLLRSTRRRDAPSMQDWASLAPVGDFARTRNGQVGETFRLYAGVGRAGNTPAAVLPCAARIAAWPHPPG